MTHRLEDAGGLVTTITGAMLWIIDTINIADVNNYIVAVTSLVGMVWVIYKVIGQRLDNKIKRKQYEAMDKDNTNEFTD